MTALHFATYRSTADLLTVRRVSETAATRPSGIGVRSVGPGMLVAVAGTMAVFALDRTMSVLSPLVTAGALGALLGNARVLPAATRPGLQFAAQRLLRMGIVLLGFRLALGDIIELGGRGLGVVTAVVLTTFFGTRYLGRRLGVSPSLSLLVATGFSICGASAIAAANSVVGAEEEDVALSVGLVTLCGTLAVLVLPLLAQPLGLDAVPFGTWAGASVHDVGQVVAAASAKGDQAVEAAILVKLTRVAMLGPLIACLVLAQRRRSAASGSHTAGSSRPVLPLFLVGFFAASLVRTAGVLSNGWLSQLERASEVVLTAALVGLGSSVIFARMRNLGLRPVALGLASWALIAAVSFVGVHITY